MGKQFRFIMDEMDKKAFFEYVRYAGRIFETKRFEGTVEILDFPSHLWLKLYLFKDEFGRLEFKEILDGKRYIDTTVSPVIEFRDTMLRENVKEIQRGRLYLEMKYYDASGVLIQKSELLDKWYRELVSWIKKQLQCVEVSSNGNVVKEYVSKSLVKLVEEGYHLLG